MVFLVILITAGEVLRGKRKLTEGVKLSGVR